jgi:cellobiose phosphorylase
VNPEKRTGKVMLKNPELNRKLYFPLFNQAGLMSAITPDFKGDLKASLNHFFLPPVSTEDLTATSYSRNFWVVPKNAPAWSVTGVSADYLVKKAKGIFESTTLYAEPGLFEIEKINPKLKIKVSNQAFVPSNNDPVEVLLFTITNEGDQEFEFSAIPAIPIYARSADNLRDHRTVTTLLNRVYDFLGGISVKPTMSFDERGHKENEHHYFCLAFDESGNTSKQIYKNLADFVGSGSLLAPAAIYNEFSPNENLSLAGKEALAAFKFETVLKPNESKSFIVISGITDQEAKIAEVAEKYNTKEKVVAEIEATLNYWQDQLHRICFETGNSDFDNWLIWIAFQPMARKIFGCSFLPDFDYGRGGRGWRDLWQDCLALMLTNPGETKDLLFHNFAGIRIDGSNATIIGVNGEFIADRNNISRTWMDHGVWPFLTINLYINQSGDFDFLLRPQTYFKDLQAHRSRSKDFDWDASYGNQLRTRKNQVYEGSILEHLILQTITQFFNVGEHNICKLEGADWNDGLDMAKDHGESVAFHTMYFHNLNLLIDYLKILKEKYQQDKIELLEEISVLFDTISEPIDYQNPAEKQKLLADYMNSVLHKVTGTKTQFSIDAIIADLTKKAENMKEIVLKQEFIKLNSDDAFFNGYYNNQAVQVEGEHKNGTRMTLTGQVFPIMSGLAPDAEIAKAYAAAKKYLKDEKLGGYHLNTNFKEDSVLDLGRAFSFSYGEKENGAYFSHMIIMFMYALYSRNFVKEAYEVFDSVFKMCFDFETNKILPSIPEYFNLEGEGSYLYLTGSASWLLLTITTQMFGIKAKLGDLELEPKLTKEQFIGQCAVLSSYRGDHVKVIYKNDQNLDYGEYKIKSITLNGQDLRDVVYNQASALINRETFNQFKKQDSLNILIVELG